jgi:hyperosmotically inducible protein
MMNSNSTHKIVVGIGLAVVFGVGVSIFAVRAKQASELARNAPAPALAAPANQNASDTTAPTPSPELQTPADQSATAPGAQPPAPPAVAPQGAHSGEISDEFGPAKWDREDRAAPGIAKMRNSADTARTRVASAASAPSVSDTPSSSPAGATAETQQSPARTGQEAAMNAGAAATSSAPVASDSQITTSVKSEIATAAPNSNVDVSTSDGVVALAGSVPNDDAVDQARQAAQRVAGVKQVDASGLTVSNQ